MKGQCTWTQARQFISDTFLGADELQHLRSLLPRVAQGSYETIPVFIRRFDPLAKKCYNDTEINYPVIQQQVMRYFIQAISNSDVRTQVCLKSPKTLDKVYALAIESDRAFTLAKEAIDIETTITPTSLLRSEEDMDISMVNDATKKKKTPGIPTQGGFMKRIDTLYEMVKKLKSQLASQPVIRTCFLKKLISAP